MNLFGYTKEAGKRIVRFQLDHAVQQEMTAYLLQQIEEFNANIKDEYAFDGKYKPDDGESLFIEPFDPVDDLPKAIASPMNFPVADPAEISFENIKGLFFGVIETDGSATVYIQHFDRRRVISDAGFSIFHSQETYKRIEGSGLTLDTKIAAKLQGTKLSFSSFFHVRQIFDMSGYYKEATESDIQDFSNIQQIHVDKLNVLIENSDSWVRRKLWLVMNGPVIQQVPINDIKTIATEFHITIESVDVNGETKIKIPENKADLKNLLRFLDEDYYKSPLSKEKFISNSKRKAPPAAPPAVAA